MIRRCADLQSVPSPSEPRRTAKSASLNGHQPQDDIHPDVFEHEMELDDQVMNDHDHDGDGSDWDKMDTEEVENGLKYQEMLQETIQYGQELRLDYRDDTRREVKKALEDTFSLMAYDDPKSSVYGYLLEPSGRVPVAEELNSAILGKNASTKSHFVCVADMYGSLLGQVFFRGSRAAVSANGGFGQRDQRRWRRRGVY
jgi:hypothetical protein